MPALTRSGTLTAAEGDPQALRSGVDRPVGKGGNCWLAHPGAWVQYAFAKPQRIRGIRLVFDSDLNRPGHNMPCAYPLDAPPAAVPATIVRAFRVEAQDADEKWRTIVHEKDNCQRLVRLAVDAAASAVRFTPEATWGSPKARVFAFDVE